MLVILGSDVPLKKAVVSVRVQSTSIARRSIEIMRGSKPIASGRLSNGCQASNKRKLNLSENIRLN
ncbi:unnamed protein product, partial [Larinioides sclopetarius]